MNSLRKLAETVRMPAQGVGKTGKRRRSGGMTWRTLVLIGGRMTVGLIVALLAGGLILSTIGGWVVHLDTRERLDRAAPRLGREPHRGLGRGVGVYGVRMAQAQEPQAYPQTMEVTDR